jgi:Putative transposase/Transposase zinc-binding domain
VRPTLEVADIVRAHGEEFLRANARTLSPAQKRVLRAIERCRTAALGGHIEECNRCGHQRIAYNSCGNRHCPKCQSLARAKWLDKRQTELLPVEYFHVVFTLPETLAALALQNKRLLYGILFRAVAESLQSIAADPKRLGARIGFFAILHTWGQTLTHHPHVHCVVPGGGLAPDGRAWVRCRPRFFLPVRVLSRRFRTLFLQYLERAYGAGKLQFFGEMRCLKGPANFALFLQRLRKSEWVVYAKPPFGGAERVLDYLGRYTHRVAISNHRLKTLHGSQVTFAYKDYKQPDQPKAMTLSATEFLRRLLLHVLPEGFQRIRYFGFLANQQRSEALVLCRELLNSPAPETPPRSLSYRDRLQQLSGKDILRCPLCNLGEMVRIREFGRGTSEPGINSS